MLHLSYFLYVFVPVVEFVYSLLPYKFLFYVFLGFGKGVDALGSVGDVGYRRKTLTVLSNFHPRC